MKSGARDSRVSPERSSSGKPLSTGSPSRPSGSGGSALQHPHVISERLKEVIVELESIQENAEFLEREVIKVGNENRTLQAEICLQRCSSEPPSFLDKPVAQSVELPMSTSCPRLEGPSLSSTGAPCRVSTTSQQLMVQSCSDKAPAQSQQANEEGSASLVPVTLSSGSDGTNASANAASAPGTSALRKKAWNDAEHKNAVKIHESTATDASSHEPSKSGSAVSSALHSLNGQPSTRRTKNSNAEGRMFEVLDSWTTKNLARKSRQLNMKGTAGVLPKARTFALNFELSAPMERPWYMINPQSSLRLFWEILSVLAVLYDVIMVPAELLDPPAHWTTSAATWMIRVFWTIDIPVSFLTGLVRPDGFLEYQPEVVRRRYLRSWFGLDIYLVGVDWLFEATSGVEGLLQIGKATRIMRFVRLARLLRLLRIRDTLKSFSSHTKIERLIIVADILRVLCAMLVVAHVMACVFYGIGNQKASTSWVNYYRVANESFWERYLVSMLWALAQFTGIAEDIRPQNNFERFFSALSFVLAFLVGAMIVGRLTSSMTRLHILSNTETKHLVILRRYLDQVQIPTLLSNKIQRHAHHMFLEQQRVISEDKVELLRLVSGPLRAELHLEMYAPALTAHPFFKVYNEECPHVMRQICHQAVSLSWVLSGDTIFTIGEMPSQPAMYFVHQGSLHYDHHYEEVHVDKGKWLSEATLWTHWTHQGTLTAMVDSQLLCLSAQGFRDIVLHFDHPMNADPQLYGKYFVAELNHEEEPHDLFQAKFMRSSLHQAAGEGVRPSSLAASGSDLRVSGKRALLSLRQTFASALHHTSHT
eukprot:TRINITY_DN26328_c0_g3_i1.p1 TRINITY_DN26328_c0_g3~~TRINITY_DN26328_c0_g3_i1.p1  ORF type:complete len:818 (+),score=138.26 TRINITY_DN26328_c0_g3_i1:98-2551(+)